jgi:hypothetical protein|tara:strand:+ start:6552 stop:6692 length:141 start_codon:yes stop_codon:yes gene_type:complete
MSKESKKSKYKEGEDILWGSLIDLPPLPLPVPETIFFRSNKNKKDK